METKKITATQLMEAAIVEDGERPEYYYVQYKGIPITIKGGFTLEDALMIAGDVADFCFLEGGEYIPELKRFFLRRELIDAVTNIELPDELSECYELIMNTSLGAWVDETFFEYLQVYADQMPFLLEAIQDKVDYMADSGLALLHSRMDALIYAIESLSEQSENLFANVSPDDVQKLASSVDSFGNIDEEKLVKAFVDQEKKSKSKSKKKSKSSPNLEVVK